MLDPIIETRMHAASTIDLLVTMPRLAVSVSPV